MTQAFAFTGLWLALAVQATVLANHLRVSMVLSLAVRPSRGTRWAGMLKPVGSQAWHWPRRRRPPKNAGTTPS